MDNDVVPTDYVAFVTTHAGRLARHCHELTGDDRLADSLRLELLAIIALRWRRWWRPARRRPETALRHLDDLLRREVRTYELVAGRAWPPPLARSTDQTAVEPAPPPDEAENAEKARNTQSPAIVAEAAWRRSRQLRRQAAVNLGAAVLTLALLAALGPGVRPAATPPPPPPLAEPPASITLLPRSDELARLGPITSPLPLQLGAAPAGPTLAASPVHRAIGVYQSDRGPLEVIAADGVRQVDLGTAGIVAPLTTSISPAGDRVVLVRDQSLVVVDLATAAVRTLPVGAVRPVLTWYTDHSVIVAGSDTGRAVDLDSDTVTPLTGVTGVDVVTGPSAQLTELIQLTSTTGQAPRLRFWRDPPAPAVAGTPARPPDVEDRPIFGPQWIGAWVGIGWSSPVLYARGGTADGVPLPERFGKPTAAVTAVQPNGIHAGTLVSVEAERVEVLGFLQPHVVLVAVATTTGTVVVAWNPGTHALNRVATLPPDTRIALANFLLPS